MANPRILLAEGDPTHRLLIKSILGENRYTIVEVEDGIKAVEAFSREDFDLVMLDVDLPHLSGFGTMSEIRKIKKEFNVPIVLVTGKGGDSEEIAEGLRSGADDFITKPFRTEEMRARVEALYRLSSSQREQIKQQKELAKFDLLKQVVITLAHYINDANSTISLYCQTTPPEDKDKVREMIRKTMEQSCKIVAVVESLNKMMESLEKDAERTGIKTVESIKVTEYIPGVKWVDIRETFRKCLSETRRKYRLK